MIKLTNAKDIIQSLILRSLGENFIEFKLNTKRKGYTILEFKTADYKFIISSTPENDLLRIYDNGHTYLIQSNENFIERLPNNLLNSIKYYSERLDDFYITKEHEDQNGASFTWFKKE